VGDIYIPQVGTIRVAGLPFAQVQSYLKAQMGKVFRNFDLNVNMGQLRSIQVFVVGQARRPGSYTISSLSTLVDALFVTGGPTPQGSLRHVQLKRSGKVVVDFDLYDLLERGDKSKDAPLLPGDVIYIPPAGLQVAVAGSVNTPAIYELQGGDGSTVAEALALASGPTNVASDALARLERVDSHSMRSVTELALDQAGLATTLKDGDILELVAISDRFRNGVTLNGNVANPGRYSWKPGMRVGDLFPDKDALITRDYWLQRERLGQPTLTYTPSLNNLLPNDQQPKDVNASTVVSAADSDDRSPSSAHSSAAATINRTQGGFSPRNKMELSAPEIDWSYAVIERQDPNTLTTSLLPFNLGSLVLEKDSSQDIELQPNDIVTIFSKADIRVPQVQQTKFVRLEGEFLSSGVYSVLPNETLPHLIQRAGGLTSDAYLYGSEFTRESTRRVQQQRLDEYIDQLSLRSGINAANTSGRNVNTIDTAASAALLAQNQNIISSLRQARAGGRIVLHLQPDTVAISQLPTLSLENGDTFIVPHNPNSFVFEQGRKLRYYLGLAGGPNRDADRKRAYVVRADGSVISKQQMSSLRGNAFESLPIYPGDTIIVPLNLNKGATLRNVVDIAQIFGQFGIALAAANVIF
jgi:protein involved in polysaccharide export with SLBB domain